MKQKIVVFSITCLSFFIHSSFAQNFNSTYTSNRNKMDQLLFFIENMYVDTVNFNNLVESGIVEMLKELDPHSTYIPAKEVQQMNEPLQGAFDGIGITYQIIKDTINIMEVIIGGPSEKVGIMVGDKIVKVDTSDATGKKINHKWVQSHLRGEKGSKVNITVKRGRHPETIQFTITRGRIPINSINTFFMVDQKTGYIKLERFAMTSLNEFNSALTKLKARGMENLIFDLRGNGGGYLDIAYKISDQFLKPNQLIVYTDNARNKKEEYFSSGNGNLTKGKLIILVDENSASASEIVSGAVQDWDRGLIMGRRTFGKGLVQKPMYLTDKSMIRLTTSYYYTPTGRCIQKPYNDGLDKYYQDLNNRYKHGEYLTADSISFPDSLKYYTPNKRLVHGGGGIMPDIFVPYDTSKYSTLYNELVRKSIFGGFTIRYMETHHDLLKERYPDINEFKANFQVSPELYAELLDYAKAEGVKDTTPLNMSSRLAGFAKEKKREIDSLYKTIDDIRQTTALDELLIKYIQDSYSETIRLRNESKAPEFIKETLKFEFARGLYNFGEAYQIYLESDDTFQQAVRLMQDEKAFKKFKVQY